MVKRNITHCYLEYFHCRIKTRVKNVSSRILNFIKIIWIYCRSSFSNINHSACLHRDENAGRKQALWACPGGTAAEVSADKAPTPSAAAPPNSWNFSLTSSLEEAALGPPCSPPPANGKHRVGIVKKTFNLWAWHPI